jgi:hypothetical protein
LYVLRRVRVAVGNKTFEDLEVGDVDLDVFATIPR